MFKRLIQYMKITDIIFLALLGLSYLMVESSIKEVQQYGFWSFIGVFTLYIANIIFRHALTAYSDLKAQKAAEELQKAQQEKLAQLKDVAIREMEKRDARSGKRTTERLKEKKRNTIRTVV